MDGETLAIITGMKEQMQGLSHKIEKYEDIALSLRELKTDYRNLVTTVDEIKESVEELKSKPAKKWDIVVTAILTGIIGALVAAFFVIPKA